MKQGASIFTELTPNEEASLSGGNKSNKLELAQNKLSKSDIVGASGGISINGIFFGDEFAVSGDSIIFIAGGGIASGGNIFVTSGSGIVSGDSGIAYVSEGISISGNVELNF